MCWHLVVQGAAKGHAQAGEAAAASGPPFVAAVQELPACSASGGIRVRRSGSVRGRADARASYVSHAACCADA